MSKLREKFSVDSILLRLEVYELVTTLIIRPGVDFCAKQPNIVNSP